MSAGLILIGLVLSVQLALTSYYLATMTKLEGWRDAFGRMAYTFNYLMIGALMWRGLSNA